MTTRRLLFLLPLFGLLIAGGIFFCFQATPQEYESSFSASFKNLPASLVVVGQVPKEVDVRMRGRASVLKAFLAGNPTCSLDLSHVTAGLATLPIGKSNFGLPRGISILHLDPTSITLRLEQKQTKTVPVTVTLTDSPTTGYKVALTMTTPSSLQISGPEKTLARIKALPTRPISLKNASESFKKEIAVGVPDGVTTGVDAGNGTPLVVAHIKIVENITVRHFKGIPVEGHGTTLPVKIAPPDIDIDVRGPENTLSRLSVGTDIKVYVELKDLAPGIYVRRAQIPLPVGTTLAGAEPEVFTVNIGE